MDAWKSNYDVKLTSDASERSLGCPERGWHVGIFSDKAGLMQPSKLDQSKLVASKT